MTLRPCKGDIVRFPNGSSVAIKYVVEEDAVVHLMNGYIVLLKDLSLSPDGERDLLAFTWVFTGHPQVKPRTWPAQPEPGEHRQVGARSAR